MTQVSRVPPAPPPAALNMDAISASAAVRIRQEREAKQWSAQQLADRCKEYGSHTLSRGTLAKIEAKLRRINIDEAFILAAVFDITVDELIGIARPEPQTPEPPLEPGTIVALTFRVTESSVNRIGIPVARLERIDSDGKPLPNILRTRIDSNNAWLLAGADTLHVLSEPENSQ